MQLNNLYILKEGIMIFIQLMIILVFSVLVVTCSTIIIPELVYRYVENTKLEKFFDSDFIKIIGIMLTVYGDAILIIGFIYIVCMI